MKRLLLILLALALATVLWAAQETYSITLVAANVALLDLGRVQQNDAVCTSHGLARGCTQAAACVACSVVGGSSCTASDANLANCRIYPDSLAGREGFTKERLVKDRLADFAQEESKRQLQVLHEWCSVPSQRDALCSLVSLPTGVGCYLCDGI